MRIEPEEKVYCANGASLVRDGIEIKLDALLSSELLLLASNELSEESLCRKR